MQVTTNDADLINKIVNDALKKKDREVHIFIGCFGTDVDIKPITPKMEPRWIKDKNRIRDLACSECGAHADFASPYCPACGEKLAMPDKIQEEPCDQK